MSLIHSHSVFSLSSVIDRPADEVFAWHERSGAFERLLPPWERVEVLSQDGTLHDGARVSARVRVGPFWVRSDSLHCDYVEGRQFKDVQVRGPFASWEHLHLVTPGEPSQCTLTDRIHYKLPLGRLGAALAGGGVRARMERAFTYRHAITRADLALAEQHGTVQSMRFLIAGASGLVGRALLPFLKTQGHQVLRLVRRKPLRSDEVFWDPLKGELDSSRLRGVDVVINLAGENVAEGRWTADRRRAIIASRVDTARTLLKGIERIRQRPFAYVGASAIGIYGNTGNSEATEEAPAGNGFLAEVCKTWEEETLAAEALELRSVALRIGVVLTPAGGALSRLLPVFRAGLGGVLGNGAQWMSWISIDDLVGAFYHAVVDTRCRGPVNAVSPEPVTNAEFTRVLARVLHRPAILRVPGVGLKLALGQMADEALLSSARVLPRKLQNAGYRFRQENLETALRHVLGR